MQSSISSRTIVKVSYMHLPSHTLISKDLPVWCRASFAGGSVTLAWRSRSDDSRIGRDHTSGCVELQYEPSSFFPHRIHCAKNIRQLPLAERPVRPRTISRTHGAHSSSCEVPQLWVSRLDFRKAFCVLQVCGEGR